MGLDMYLHKRTYVKNWDHMKPEELHQVIVHKNGQPTTIKPGRVKEITEEVAYWRKANQIHRWFVENVQKGVDNCGDYYVSRKQLEKLLNEVTLALRARHLAPEILPTKEGFFFGSQEYDEYYWEDLADTEKQISAILKEPEDSGEFYYHSSW